MNICPITYEECGERMYSEKGLRLLSRRLKHLDDFPYSAEEQVREAALRAARMSIQGVQPKLSVRLNTQRSIFEVVDSGGVYIIKPQVAHYPELPQNEDLTMRLADMAGLNVPLHGLVYSKDGTFSYFIRRFDRAGRGQKHPVEDFAQLSGKDRETKYSSSMEQVARIIDRFCTFPAIEKVKLFQLTLFNFLVGNEDSHLKNYSLIRFGPRIELSPAYDLVNTTVILNALEEIALPIHGKKNKLTYDDLIIYFAGERLKLTDKSVSHTLNRLKSEYPRWLDCIDRSFLSTGMKTKYSDLLKKRAEVLKMIDKGDSA